jgi:hypothetical protein
MNANAISPKSGFRLNRIRIVSRFARIVVLAFLLFYALFFFGAVASHFPGEMAQKTFTSWNWFFVATGLTSGLYHIVLCVWYWKLARLFRLYERGLIFGAETIRCIKSLGFLCVIGGFLFSAITIMAHSAAGEGAKEFFIPKFSEANVMVTQITLFKTGFFSFDFGTGFDFGLVLTGIVIVLIAWIMDEGRKIQEEQELTV